MTDMDADNIGRGQQPGADAGDDGDVPDDPLLDPPTGGAGTTDVVGGEGMSEAGLGGGEGDLGGGGGLGGDLGDLDEEGSAA